MFRKIFIVLLIVVFILTALIGCSTKGKETYEESNEDLDKIRETALNYIEGWYEGDFERMEKSLHPELIKRRVEGDIIDNLDRDSMVGSTKRGGGKAIPKDSYEIKVKILDVHNNIATVMTESQYVDYLHLAKIDDEWLIINVLWDFK